MSLLKHIWWAIRYGDWYCGFERKNACFSCSHMYYDGNHAGIRIWWFYLSVSY